MAITHIGFPPSTVCCVLLHCLRYTNVCEPTNRIGAMDVCESMRIFALMFQSFVVLLGNTRESHACFFSSWVVYKL